MVTSTEIGEISKVIGEERAVELVAKSGFGAWDYSMFAMTKFNHEIRLIEYTDHTLASDNYASFSKRLRKIGEDNGIVCNQAHAPFPTCLNKTDKIIKRAIECSAIAGAKICVVHPINNGSLIENAQMYKDLLPFAKEHGVKIATENMWNWNYDEGHAKTAACSHHNEFKEYIDFVSDPYFTACLDIGHAEMKGLDTSAVLMIKTLADRIGALHIHDNDLLYDCHGLPFTMKIDFNAVINALKEIGYSGDVTLEVNGYLESKTESEIFEKLKNASSVANKILNMLNS
ncbi:MAG: sugar phosphate isomerase/epimerase [Clostridia bacterium]|nr:sugar phosphate isomerase/epimerase [Clostridia bacterium]